jgi:phospholipid/cholesterol/gamma-HCH transport system ATP-binding protein
MGTLPHASNPERAAVKHEFAGLGASEHGLRMIRWHAMEGPPDAPATNPLIVFDAVSKAFGGPPVLDQLDLRVPTGKTTVILGPSGAGKSVMLKLMIGLLRPEQGEILCAGDRVDLMSERDLFEVRRRVGFLFQQGALFDSMTVLENVAFPLREHTQMDTAARLTRVRDTLALLGVDSLIDRLPAELSGGQRKRVALARAIVLRPECLLYDEPTTGLDPIRSDVVAKLIQMLQQELQPTSVVVTHDIPLAFKIADQMLLLRHGRMHLAGPPEVFSQSDDPVVRSFLDGHATADELRAIDSEVAA